MFDKDNIKSLKEKLKEWEEKRERKALEKLGERQGLFETHSQIPVKRLYTPKDIQDFDYERDNGFPGDYPFTRGIYPVGYRSRTWQARQVCGFATPEETNERLKYLIEMGETGVTVVFDLPTNNHAIDSDNPLAEGQVGMNGLPVDTLQDMEDAFDGIDIVKYPVTLIARCPVMLFMLIAVAEKRGIDLSKLRGTSQLDFLTSYVANKQAIFPAPKEAFRYFVDIIEYLARNMPNWNPMAIGGYAHRDSGTDAVQEMAFMLSGAISYTQAFLDRGLRLEEFAPKFTFFMGCHNNFFEEIAKFRATRKLWARIMKERFGAKDPRAMLLRLHVQTDGNTLTAEQALNNIARVAIQSLASLLGGVSSLHSDSYDEAICIPTEESARISLRTQQILLEETGVADTIDPLAGSYYVEWLTKQLEERASKLIGEIDAMGGMPEAIESGWLQRKMDDSVNRYWDAIRKGERTVVGLNKYRIKEEIRVKAFKVDPSYERKQLARLKKVKAERDNEKVKSGLSGIQDAVKKGENIVPPSIEAVKAYATLEEIMNALFGDKVRAYREVIRARHRQIAV
ncbi:MAG: methylmalonyl-CoA mutase [Deltaproteobacteria bacterium]|jgi:methylmalonyl-CoA mutase N-terminal domain/subunit|nr:MAG: methylmalonyl-CoA mutase [Deltaproteobacteria bacterium]